MTKIPYGIRENAKYLDGIRDLTATKEVDSPKFGHGMRDLCLSVGNSGNLHDPNKRSSGKNTLEAKEIGDVCKSESTRRALNGVAFKTIK